MSHCSGESGSYLYVAAEGEFEVVKAGKNLGRLGVGKVGIFFIPANDSMLHF